LSESEGGGVSHPHSVYLCASFCHVNLKLVSYAIFFYQVLLPSGGRLTPKMLQCLGLSGLGSGGGFERLHYL
ncbi:hypothetical protein, partial [Klebsiella grimontii]|uniref:hypothetical protein n=1 Tax=Klebsiella grimontii TaxID=2058152 RepID=UPI002FC5B144